MCTWATAARQRLFGPSSGLETENRFESGSVGPLTAPTAPTPATHPNLISFLEVHAGHMRIMQSNCESLWGLSGSDLSLAAIVLSMAF